MEGRDGRYEFVDLVPEHIIERFGRNSNKVSERYQGVKYDDESME